MVTCARPMEPYLLVHVELAEDLRGVEEMGVVDDPGLESASCTRGREREREGERGDTYFLAFQPTRGKLRMRGSQYPLMRKRKVRKAWTAASGMM